MFKIINLHSEYRLNIQQKLHNKGTNLPLVFLFSMCLYLSAVQNLFFPTTILRSIGLREVPGYMLKID